ncbi:MAG: hypothetical protein R3Y53_06130 [Bacillota bacterium]
MSEKILNQLYYGKIEPVTKKVSEGSEYRRQQKVLDETEKELRDQLDESGKKKLEILMEAWSDLDYIGNEERFIEGVNSFCYAKLLRSRRILRR